MDEAEVDSTEFSDIYHGSCSGTLLMLFYIFFKYLKSDYKLSFSHFFEIGKESEERKCSNRLVVH